MTLAGDRRQRGCESSIRGREGAWRSRRHAGRDDRCILNLQPNITRLASLVDEGMFLIETRDE